MQGKSLFLRWTLFMCLVVIAAFIGLALGGGDHLASDPTHITYLTLTVFALASLWCGRCAWKLSNGSDPTAVEEDLAHGWFASSLCVTIGLIGTAVGYYIMLKNGNASGDPSEVIRRAFANTSIAIVNTIFGAVGGALVELQSHFVGTAVAKAKRLAAKDAEDAEEGEKS